MITCVIPVDVNRTREQTLLVPRSSVQGSQEYVFLTDRSRQMLSSNVARPGGVTGAFSMGAAGCGCRQDLSAKLHQLSVTRMRGCAGVCC